MKTRAYILLLLLAGGTAIAEEVLPALSQEKMSEYKNEFGKAIRESLSEGPKNGLPNQLQGVTQKLRDDLDKKGGLRRELGPHGERGGDRDHDHDKDRDHGERRRPGEGHGGPHGPRPPGLGGPGPGPGGGPH